MAQRVNGDVMAHSGGVVALQTAKAVVLVLIWHFSQWKNSEDRQIHCVYCKISGQRGKPPLEANKSILYKLLFLTTVPEFTTMSRAVLPQVHQHSGGGFKNHCLVPLIWNNTKRQI